MNNSYNYVCAYLLKFHPGWSYAVVSIMQVLTVSHPFYAPLNLRADKLVILIIFLPNNEEFFFHGTSLEIRAVSNF